MSKIKLTGENSGYVEISAGQNAGNNTLQTPTSGTRLVAHEGSQDVTLNANLTVNGVLTYDDVTNIDSVGVITARAGVNVTGGSVGIGTDAPAAGNKLHLHDTSACRIQLTTDSTGHTLSDGTRLMVDSSNNFEILNRENSNIEFFTNNAQRVTISSSGSVGIGLTNPSAPLHLSGPAEIRLNNATDAGNFARIRCFEESGDNGAHLAFNTGTGEVVRFQNDGKVGVGINVPARLLHLHESNSNEALISFTTPTTGATASDGFRVGMNGSEEALVWNNESGIIKFGTANTERLRIDSSGRLLVGTDSTIFDNNFGIGKLQATHKDGYQHVLFSGHSAAAANATCLSVGRSRGTQASPGYLSSGDHIARFSATSYNGGNYQSSGCIDFYAADQHASNDLPGYIALKTVPDGSATLTERLRVLADGTITTGGASATPGTVAAGSIISAAANAGVFVHGYDGKFGTSSNHPLYFQTNGITKATITAAGAFSVGTTSPQQPNLASIHVHSTANDDCRIAITTPSKPDSRIGYFGLSNKFGMDVHNGFEVRDASASYATRLTITSTGQVGLGFDSPTAPLHGRVTSGGYNAIFESTANGGESVVTIKGKKSDGTVRSAIFKYDNADMVRLGTSQSIPLRFETSDLERLRVTENGRVLINRTTPTDQALNNLSSDVKLVVNGSTITKHGYKADVGTSYVSIPGATVGNESSVFIVSVQGNGGGNFHSTATYILCSGAYAKTFTQLGSAAGHFGNGVVQAQLSSYSGTSSSVQVRRSGSSGTCDVQVHMFKII